MQQIFSGKLKKNDDVSTYTQDEVIYVLDDFDCMSDIFMDRDLKDKKQDDKDIIDHQKLEIEYLKKQLKHFKTRKNVTKQEPSKHDDNYLDDIIDDFDRYPKGDFYTTTTQITLQNILEILDGVIEMDGRMIIMTTNKRDILDPALIRPGRIDLDLEFKYPTRDLILYIFNYMYKNYTQDERHDVLQKYGKYIKDSELSTAKIINCFMYIDMNVGMENLLSNYNYDIDSGYCDNDPNFDAIETLEKITREITEITKKKSKTIKTEIPEIDLLQKFKNNIQINVSTSISGTRSSIMEDDSNELETNFSSKYNEYIEFEFPEPISITRYSIFNGKRCIMCHWELVGTTKDGKETKLDERFNSTESEFTGQVTNCDFYKCITLKTIGESKFTHNSDIREYQNSRAMNIRFIQFFGNVV